MLIPDTIYTEAPEQLILHKRPRLCGKHCADFSAHPPQQLQLPCPIRAGRVPVEISPGKSGSEKKDRQNVIGCHPFECFTHMIPSNAMRNRCSDSAKILFSTNVQRLYR